MVYLLLATVLWTGPLVYPESPDSRQLYLDGRFNEIIQYFKANESRQDFQALTSADKLVYIECLARTSRGREAATKLMPFLAQHDPQVEVLATAAIVYFSLGQFSQARDYLEQARALPGGVQSPRVMLTGVMLDLYNRLLPQALAQYLALLKSHEQWRQSDLMFILGLDIYRAVGDVSALGELYKNHAGKKHNRSDKRSENLKADAKIYNKATNEPMFRVETGRDKIIVPFIHHPNNLRVNTISMTIKGKTYNVLLDTGNATGWTVHNRDLRDVLDSKKGSRTFTKIGIASSLLDGFRYFYKKVDFNAFTLLNMDGVYVPKPYSIFPDANLNPIFISNCVVTLDFAANEMVLRTPERFQQDMAEQIARTSSDKQRVSRFPWVGYKDAMVRGTVNGHEGLCLLETGAEDIALKESFARTYDLPLQEKKRFSANGSVFKYFLTPVLLRIGEVEFKREGAEVWSLERFYHPITGLSPDVILGPKALTNLSISFDPFTREVIVIDKSE